MKTKYQKALQQFKSVQVDIFFVYGLSLCLVVILSVLKITSEQNLIKRQEETVKEHQITFFHKEAFDSVKILGEAYIVYDLVTGEVISSKQENKRLPLASLSKVMTAITASSIQGPEEEDIEVDPSKIDGGYDLGLKNNQVWELKELLKYMLVFSSNDAAYLVASHYGGKSTFVSLMNQKAESLSLALTFTDPAGLDVGGHLGGIGTVKDVARMFGEARKQIPELMDATTKKRQTVKTESGKLSGVPNTNQSIQNLPGAEGSKTGFTDEAGGNLGVIVDPTLGHPVVIVVLGSTREGRFKDVAILYETLRKSITSSSTEVK